MDVASTREPDFASDHGVAWKVVHEGEGWGANIRFYYVKLFNYHPILKWFVLAVNHLRDAPGVKPAKKLTADMTHEFLVAILDPETYLFEEFNPDDRAMLKKVKFMQPMILDTQQPKLTDDFAAFVLDNLTVELLNGYQEPDENTREKWIESINTLKKWTPAP
jgi:hypothetical protein